MPAKRAQPKTKPLTVGQLIRQHRLNNCMSQDMLAKAIGYTGKDASSVISRFETGGRSPRIETVRQLAAAMGIKISELIA